MWVSGSALETTPRRDHVFVSVLPSLPIPRLLASAEGLKHHPVCYLVILVKWRSSELGQGGVEENVVPGTLQRETSENMGKGKRNVP